MGIKEKIISIVIPVYNSARYLRECMDSIMGQTFKDFEVIMIDDGSTDDSVKIIASYQDPRIKLIRNNHDYIQSLNMGMTAAQGKYIARMDSDDVMLPERLQLQYEYMEKNPEVDVLGGGMKCFGKSNNEHIPKEIITIWDMLDGCCVIHPTVMMRSQVIKDLGFKYEEEYIYAEDYRLWVKMMQAGLCFRNLQKILIYYRLSDTQITCQKSDIQITTTNFIREETAQWLINIEENVKSEKICIPSSRNELTLVIPFLNEGDEVANTVKSVRKTVGNRVDIIVINDNSDDGYDYMTDLNGLNVFYVHNKFRIGAAASKEKGAGLVATPYFLLLDAHMRFYDDKWVDRILEELHKNDSQLLCCQTKVLHKKDGIVVENEQPDVYGASLSFNHDEYIPGIRWNNYRHIEGLGISQIPAVLGAGYATGKKYWKRIKGLQGLIHYGCEEAYISIKAWLDGGGCRLLPDVVIGHIYRDKFPYSVVSSPMIYNNLFIAETLFPTSMRCLAHSIAINKDKDFYRNLKRHLSWRSQQAEELRTYYRETFKNDFMIIKKMNNILETGERAKLEEEKKRLSQIMDYLDKRSSICYESGLYNGLMGYIIAFCMYAKCFGEPVYDEIASILFEKLCSDLMDNELPVTFGKGICGIGWGIIYLIEKGLLEDDMEEELNHIDRLVMERNPGRIQDLSVLTGIGGIFCYVVTRLGYMKRNKKDNTCFDKKYIEQLQSAASRTIKSEDIDYRCRNFGMQLMEYGSASWSVLPPEFEEIIDLPEFLPREERFWETGLKGATGFSIQTISMENMIRACRS